MAPAEKGSGWELHSTQHMLLTADDTSSCIHAAAVRAMIDGIEIKCSFLSFFSLLASWPACSWLLLLPSTRAETPRTFRRCCSARRCSSTHSFLPTTSFFLFTRNSTRARHELPRARCRTRSRARSCEHRKGASVSHVAHEQLPQWQSLSSSWTPFRRLPFRLQRSEYSCESHEILATAGAPDAARVTVPARQVAARTRPWRGHLVPAACIRGHRSYEGAVSKPRVKPHGSLTHPAAWAHRRGGFLADQRATAPPSPRGAAPRRPAARGRPLADVSRADR